MGAQTDVYIEPKESKRHLADSYWEQRSQLLLPHRLRLNVARVAAVMLPERAVGSIWTPCRPHDTEISKALCLYLNSTPGLLSLLGPRDNRVPSYPSFSLDTLRSLAVPDFTALGDAERDMMGSWFDWLQNETLQPFPQMHEDPVRRRIDDVVVQALGVGWRMGGDDTAGSWRGSRRLRTGAGRSRGMCWKGIISQSKRRAITGGLGQWNGCSPADGPYCSDSPARNRSFPGRRKSSGF